MSPKKSKLIISPSVSILMSTFNGGLFLNNQIESILNQSHKNFKLIIRDDGSSDDTLAIINNYIYKYPDVIYLLDDKLGNIGSTKSFFRLLNYVNDESYIMFSDQDDIWFENKVELFINKIQDLEILNVGLPALVFGDMVVSDSELKILNNSFWNFQKINPLIIFNWKKILSQNIVTGCSMIINNNGKKVIQKLPNIRMIHDHFIAIVISKNGLVDFIKEPTMYYVQHNNNLVGASSFNFNYIFKRILKLRETLFQYYKLCRYFEMNFFYFFYLKFTINLQRILSNK
jgi:glycosyltransferase involved in cell wall biosynthesis